MSQTTHALVVSDRVCATPLREMPLQGLLAQWLFLSLIWELGANLFQIWVQS